MQLLKQKAAIGRQLAGVSAKAPKLQYDGQDRCVCICFWTTKRSIYMRSDIAAKDPYYILGVTRDEKMSVIKAKYFELAKKHHPDHNPDDEQSREMFMRIQEAYRMIQIERDPDLKLKF